MGAGIGRAGRAIGLLAVLAIGAGACGSSSNGGSSDDTTEANQAAPTDEGEATPGGTLKVAMPAEIDGLNPARVQRAWEVLQATGRGLADWQGETPAPLLPLASVQALVMRPERDWLAARIDQRFDMMMAAGALDEARAELPTWEPNRPSARAIGAPELIAHLRGEMPLAAAVAAGKLASRQYAKRQRTWFRSRMAAWTTVALP